MGTEWSTQTALLAMAAGIAFAVFVVRSVRSASIRPVFAWMWVAVATFLVSVPFLAPFYRWVSVEIVGMNDARHIVYIPLILFLLVYSCYLTTVVSKLSDRVQELITHVAILESDREQGGQ
jgi:hypothetical protein